MAIRKLKPDPRRLMLQIQAERELHRPGPTTWAKVVGDDGHVRVLGRQLIDNEKHFRAAVAVWYKQIAKAILEGIRDGDWRQSITEEHRDRLREIVEFHVRRGALLSSAVEWEMHRRHPSTKACLTYVQKGVWEFVKSLPVKVLQAVKAVVAGVMLVFNPDQVIDPILAKVDKAVEKSLEDAPNEKHTNALIAADVQALVFTRERIESLAAGVATTKNAAAVNSGSVAAGEVLAQQGLTNAKRWATLHGTHQIDNRVRYSHEKANYQTVPIDGLFEVEIGHTGQIEECDHPGDPVLSAANREWCRCLSINVWVDPSELMG